MRGRPGLLGSRGCQVTVFDHPLGESQLCINPQRMVKVVLERLVVDALVAKVVAGATPADLETERLDFKQPKGTIKETIRDLTEAAVCFANASGGTLVVGIRDQP